MAKAVRWQIPFVSTINNIPYRLEIYDNDGDWSGITVLRGGPNPFVTDEDDNNDFFAPIRIQTGTIQVCTDIPSGGTLRLDDILPANNIERPVKLIRVDDGDEYVDWQGFLSCEAYNQDYVGTPQILNIPVMSVLEAMASVECDISRVNGLKYTRLQLYYALTELDRQTGMQFFTDIVYDKESANIMYKYLDATILYNINEYTNESNTTYVVGGLSCKDIVMRICTYMGWCAREENTTLYLTRIGDNQKLYASALENLSLSQQDFLTQRIELTVSSDDIADMEWRGTGHQKSVMQGAKSVEVVASLKKYALEMGLPDFPTEDMIAALTTYFEAYITKNINFNNMLSFDYYEVSCDGTHLSAIDTSDIDAAYDDCTLNPLCDRAAQYPTKYAGQAYLCTKNVGPFFCKLLVDDYVDGLYIVASNNITSGENAPVVFKMRSLINYSLTDGSLTFSIKALTMYDGGTEYYPFMGKAYIRLIFGNFAWNGSAWVTDTSALWEVDFADMGADDESGERTITIPVSIDLIGEVSIEILGSINGGTTFPNGDFMPFYDLFLYELGLSYEEPEYLLESDRSENKYYRLLGSNFRNEVSVSTELASNLNNQPSPSIVMNGIDSPMSNMSYTNADGTIEPRRPEVDLLNRLAAYYSASRQTLTLEVKHLSIALPITQLNGINDGRVYAPMAESRDWKGDVSTITCMELPNE